MVRLVLVCMKGTGRLSRAKPNRQTELQTLRAEVGERERVWPVSSQEETGGERRPSRKQPMKGSVERRLLWWRGS